MIKKALLVIDVQKYYVNKHTKHIPSKIVEYIKRNDFNHILFSKFVNHEKSNLFKTFGWDKMQNSPDTDICDELKEYIKTNNVFQKDTYSVFKSKSFIKHLEKNNITNLSLCGLDTDACILATAYEGFDLGYKMNVLDDLTASHCGGFFRDSGLKIINKNIQIKQSE